MDGGPFPCALLAHLQAPLAPVFGVILLDAGLKYLPFRNALADQLAQLGRS